MSKIEVVGSAPGIFITVAGGGEADIAAVVGTESVPERVTNPFVARTTVVDVGDLRLLVQGDTGLALVGSGLVSSSADRKGLIDGLALEAGSFEPCIHKVHGMPRRDCEGRAGRADERRWWRRFHRCGGNCT